MPIIALTTALMLALTLAAPAGPKPESEQQKAIELLFYDPYDRSSFQFSISEEAHVAVFELGRSRASLVYPAIGDQLRRLRRGEVDDVAGFDDVYAAGRHMLPLRSGRVWSGATRSGNLMKGDHILVLASKRPFRFEQLNSLYEDEGEMLRLRYSLGVVEDLPDLLLRTILADYAADDWASWLHWVRPLQRH